jgi:phenylalanyl-tRNA synthetase beta chain
MGIAQERMIAGVITGTRELESWLGKSEPVDFYDIKADVEALLAKSADEAVYRFEPVDADDAICTALHPGQSAVVYKADKVIGYVGAVHPAIEKKLGLNGKTFVFELELDAISSKRLPEAKPVSKFPSNRRDIAVVVKEEVHAGHVLAEIEKVGGNQLVDLNLFDVYRGDNIESGYKSLAISLVLQDVEKTLEEQDIATKVDQVVTLLTEKFGATLRD